MCIKNRGIALVFRLVMLAGCTLGLWMMLFQDGNFNTGMLVFYTNLSNIVCWVFFIGLTIKTIIEIRSDSLLGTVVFMPRLKGCVTMMITVTFIVFAVLLAPLMFTMTDTMDEGSFEMYSISNILVHYFTPIMVILDWILFDEKPRYGKFEPFIWLAIPYTYLAFALVRAEFGGEIMGMGSRYPYFFLDVDKFGWSGVALWVLGITAFFIALGYLLLLIDRLKIENKRLRIVKPEK